MENTRLALCDVRGPLNDLNDKLAGEDGYLWAHRLKKFLRSENPWGAYGFRPWKTIMIGDKTKEEFREDVIPFLSKWWQKMPERQGWDEAAFAAVKIHHVSERIDLFRLAPIDLGFEENAPSSCQLRERIIECGFDVCPQETGYRLGLQHELVPGVDTWTIVMSEPIIVKNNPVFFQFGNNSADYPVYAGTINDPVHARYGIDTELIVGRFRR